MFNQSIVITVTFKMLHIYIFIKKNNENVIQQSNTVYSSKSNEKDLNVSFKMGLSEAIYKRSLIRKLKLLESLDKMVKSLKFMLQSQVSK